MGAQCGCVAAGAGDKDKLKVYLETMGAQWKKCLDNPTLIQDTAASKRSPFKFDSKDSKNKVEFDLGVSAVALPDANTDFGRRYLAMVDGIQDLWEEYMPSACKIQTTPHMSIGSIVLDKHSPQEYNDEIDRRSGLIASAKMLLDGIDGPPRARIQTLKINPDGCVTLQLEQDPAQNVVWTEAELDEALGKVPTCQGEAAASEKNKFEAAATGTYTISRFQQVRLALGALGSEIKGLYPAGHMVVINLCDPKVMTEVPSEKLDALWTKCYQLWTPLLGEWFELDKVLCLCYVERSMNEGSVVLAPTPGLQPKAFPETSETAQALLGGIFTATANGDVLIDIERFEARRADKGRGEWQSFGGELREMAANMQGGTALRSDEVLAAVFKVFDTDGTGSITPDEVAKAMTNLGERITADELETMMRCADIDSSGEISYNEFVTMMRAR